MDDDIARETTHKDDVPADPVVAAVLDRFPGTAPVLSHGQPVLYVDRRHWRDLARFLRDEQQFTSCMDLTAVDQLLRPARPLPAGVRPERFEVVANYLSHHRNARLRAICQVPDGVEVDSLVGVFPGVEFPEREVYDLLGVPFTGHPDLTRILMPDDWEGHPLRKDDAPSRVPVQFKGAPGSDGERSAGRREGGS